MLLLPVMVIVILLVLGICFGSFVNAFIWRFHEKAALADAAAEASTGSAAKSARKSSKTSTPKPLTTDELSIMKGRSMCVHCHHELAAKDLVPVVSYMWLRGRCRYCRKPIQDSPLAELLTPFLFVASYVWWPQGLHGTGLFAFCGWLVFVVGFVMLTLYDLRWYELPHKIVLPLIGLAVVYNLVLAVVYGGGLATLLHAGLGAVTGGGLFYLIYIFSPKMKTDDGDEISAWIGGGDITLGTLLGLLVGGPSHALLLIFLASLVGTIIAVPLLLTGKASRTSHLPFGPFLMAGACITMLFGASLIAWYGGQILVR